jgi:pimeloyl-ACP methyl ester carboxylesterase
VSNDAPMKRRLAAILAADIAGYSRLMGEDEAATVRDLKGHQAVVLPLIARHGVAITYAVRHPERVSHLVLYGGYAVGRGKRARSEAEREELAAMLTLTRLGWGKENPAGAITCSSRASRPSASSSSTRARS